MGGHEEYIKYKENFKVYRNSKGKFSRARNSNHREAMPRNIQIINPSKPLTFDSITVESIPIDHSLPDVCGFLIHTSEGDIGYTADIRFHGRAPENSQKFVDRCGSENLDYLLCEGTRVDKQDCITEFDVKSQTRTLVEKTDGLVVCTYPTRDLDRFLSFYNSAKTTGRYLVIDTKQAYLLKLFQTSEEWKDIYPSPKIHISRYLFQENHGGC